MSRMSDSESIKKMLRSVLQSSKSGVSINRLQSEFRSLCGEPIPLKKLGYSKLEDYLRSIPSVVRLDYRMGELTCFAAVCKETAHIAELVARQKSSKKSGRSQVINCKMRFKPSNPYMLNVRPRSSLRQPSAAGVSKWAANRSRPHGGYRGFSASGDYRQMDRRYSAITPVEHRQPASQQVVKQCPVSDRKEKNFVNCHKPQKKSLEQACRVNQSQSNVYDVELLQSRISELLQSYCSGLWMSKVSTVYSEMFGEKLHPQALKDLEKWTHICMVEQHSCTNRVDRLVYPPLPPKPSVVPRSCTTKPPATSPTSSSTNTLHISSSPSTPERRVPVPSAPVPKPRFSSKSPLAKPTFIFPPQSDSASPVKVSSTVMSRNPVRNPAVAPQPPPCASLAVNASAGCKDNHNLTMGAHNQKAQPLAPTWTLPTTDSAPASPIQPDVDILSFMKVTFSPTPDSSPKTSAVTVSDEVRQRLKELLSKYSTGLWAHALPALFLDTYKTPFPEHVLENLSALLDICNVEFPIPGNKNKAILYNSSKTDTEATDSQESQESRSQPLPSGLKLQGPVIPPRLVPPSEQYSSVLVTDAKSSSVVTVRYVGENYSDSQEAMEDAMRSFYNQEPSQQHPSKPVVGQLVAVRGEDTDELARAQVMEVMEPNKVKVYYVDYGFSVETNWINLLELHQDFFSLPFQATNVRLAGLEIFSSHPLVLSTLEKMAVGKILLMETLEPCQQSEMPVTVLYDTSQDEDVNINSTCLKSLQDKTMNNPLSVNVTYQDVRVTNVCADGIIYCQLPSRGTARLGKLLEKMEAFFISQMTSESLVSRPFCGKFCLARYKGKLSRAEITNTFNNRVIEILYIDLGIPATVEVTDLREIPPVLLKDFTIIPPQAIKCRLADLKVPEGDWSPEATLWLQEAVLDSQDCKMKVVNLEEHKEDRLAYMYLFIGSASQELDNSINHQLIHSELWQKPIAQNTNKSSDIDVDTVEKSPLSSLVPNRVVKDLTQPCDRAEDLSHPDTNTKTELQRLKLPPSLELPQPGQNLDVFVPVACHPGYFVLQPWQELHKLVVLMGEMILYYNQTLKINTTTHIQKGDVFAAKIDKNWHRVQVKSILANGLVSVYELDHGKHELVRSNFIRPLIEEFRQLPFQAITAQLAGVTQRQWSEEASMLFRNHVEKRALVAHVESVQDCTETGELWDRRITVYLVDTTLDDRDIWVHNIMADIDSDLSSAA